MNTRSIHRSTVRPSITTAPLRSDLRLLAVQLSGTLLGAVLLTTGLLA